MLIAAPIIRRRVALSDQRERPPGVIFLRPAL